MGDQHRPSGSNTIAAAPECHPHGWLCFGFTLLLIVATSLLFGLAPGIVFARQEVSLGLSTAGPRSTSNAHQRRLSSVLVITELALALMLLASSALLIRTFVGLLNTDPGFQSQELLTGKITLSDNKYAGSRQKGQFFEELLSRLQSLPGVASAAGGSSLPFTGHGMRGAVRAEGQPDLPPTWRRMSFLTVPVRATFVRWA